MNINFNIAGVTGILDSNAASILAVLTRQKGVLLRVITHTELLDVPTQNKAFLSLPQPPAVVSVLFHFMREMKWKRIGLITKSTDAYYFSIAETLLLQVTNGNESIVISPYKELSHVTSAIRKIVKLNTRIIFVSLNAEWSIRLLCAAWEAGLVWPEYAWIFHGFQADDLLAEPTSVCDIKKAVNGIFHLRLKMNLSQICHAQKHFLGSCSPSITHDTFQAYQKLLLSTMSLSDQMGMLSCCTISSGQWQLH